MDEGQSNLFLLYADNDLLYENYIKTVQNPVDVSSIQNFHNSKNEFKSKVSAWGFNPTKDNEKVWNEINKDDIVLFFKNGRYFSKGHIHQKIKSKELSHHLWTNSLHGKFWELIIFIGKTEKIDIDYFSSLPFFVNPVMPNEYIFPVKKVQDDKLKTLIDKFGSIDDALISLSKLQEQRDPLLSEINSLQIPNDIKFHLKQTLSKYRVGQERFKQETLRNYANRCAVCEIEEIDLLEASHIMPVKEIEYAGLLQNGICLCVLHHTMFDKGYLSFDDEYQVIMNKNKKIEQKVKDITPLGKKIGHVPIPPSKELLALHRIKFGF